MSPAFELPLDQLGPSGFTASPSLAIECRDPEYVGPLYDRLAPWVDQCSCTSVTVESTVRSTRSRLAIVLGHFDEADSSFAQATAFCDRVRTSSPPL